MIWFYLHLLLLVIVLCTYWPFKAECLYVSFCVNVCVSEIVCV